jgi:RNA polymerase sigma-70 factor (ECF subfamily)
VTAADGDIVGRVRRGDRDAFGLLVQQHQARLFGLVLMMVRERAGAEDVAQEAFVRAYTHLDSYDIERPFYPWLAAIAVRLAQNWLRSHGRSVRREGTELEDAKEQPSSNENALHVLLAGEQREQLWTAVSALPSGERTAVVLYYRDELAVRDIAAALGVSVGTIKTLLFRARRHLRARLGASILTGDPST